MITKICGITNPEDALHALDAGADMLGFIFYPPSPRSIRPDIAHKIVTEIRSRTLSDRPLSQIRLVGVFVNEHPETMRGILNAVRLDFAQLSGSESLDVLLAMQGRAYKVVRTAEEAAAVAAAQRAVPMADGLPELLLEADHPTLYGGTGQRVDEALAAQLSKQYRLLLAGGITPDNVRTIATQIRPWGVDVASGVELRKGKKDPRKVQDFIRQANA
jgi:phosphoribosylanthranilate isomerase